MTILTVGTGQRFNTITAAVAAARAGDTVAIQAGTYVNDFPPPINGLTLEGVGGMVKLVATAQPGNGKAYLDVIGSTTLKNLDISGVTVPDRNGAAIRYEGGDLLIQNSVVHGNQNGILGAAAPDGTITIRNSEFFGNGTSTGLTHNIYIGDIASFTLTDSYVHDANTGHEIKSRAENNFITNNRIADNASTASYGIDLPNGGNALISGNVIQKSATSGNRVAIAYGEEGSLHTGTAVSITNNTFVSDQTGADVLWDAAGTPINAAGNSTFNFAAVDKAGKVSGGFSALSSRPVVNGASPVDPAQASTVDIAPPVLTAKESVSGASKRSTDILSGAVSDRSSGVARVEIYDTVGGRTVDLGAATLSGTGWSFTASGLAEGTHAFTAIATDTAGNSTAAVSTGKPLIVDTTAPTLTVAQSISGITTSTSNTLSGTIADFGSGAAVVEIFVGSGGRSTNLGAASLNGNNWSYSTHELAPGTYTFFAVGYDKACNTTATIKTGPAMVVTAPIAPPTLTATQSVAGLTNCPLETLRGTVSSTGSSVARVEIHDTVGGRTVDLGAATLNGAGWSFIAGGLADGTHAFTAVATDAAGNSTAAVSAGAPLIVDTAAPVLTGGQSVCGVTTDTSNILSGTISDAGSGVTAVEIYASTAGQTIDLGPATLNGSNWSYTASNLTPGNYDFSAVGLDVAGNSTTAIKTGPTAIVTRPVTPPTLTATESASGLTNAATGTISGTVSSNGSTVARVEVYDNTSSGTVDLGAATLSGSGWSFTASALADGSHAFSAVATDALGNSTTISAGAPLVVDTRAPTLAATQSVSGTTASSSNILSGTVADLGSGVAAVEIFVSSGGRTTDLGSASLNGGTWSYTAGNLTPGTYSFYAVGYDKAGNATGPLATGPAETVVAAPKSTVSAAAFTASIGVNTHLDNLWSTYRDTATVIGALKYLGVSKIRDSMAAPNDATLFKTVADATGARFNVYLSISGFTYDGQIAEMKKVAGILVSAEGINEGDSALANVVYQGQTGYAAIAAAQAALYDAIKNDPATSGISVIAPSYGKLAHFAIAPNTAAVSDYGNAHEYFGTGNQPGGGINTFLTTSALVSGNDPVISTEAGYYTGGSLSGSIVAYQHSGVSEAVQAKYNLTMLFDNWKAGISTTYLYELMDRTSDPGQTSSEFHYGLFNADGTPKLGATAVHNLLTILADNGPARSDPFGYQIANAPSTANSLLMQKSNGVFELAVWNDIRLQDSLTGVELVNPAVPVTLSFGQLVRSVTQYDPLTGTRSVLSLSNVDHVSINLPDHPVIFEITPYPAAKIFLQSYVLPETVGSNQSTANLASLMLGNAIDTDPNALSTVRITGIGTTGTQGRVTFDAATQSVVYTAPTYSPLSPTDSFTYTVADANGDAVTGTVAITETSPPNTLYGTQAGIRLNAPGTGWTLVSLAPGEQLYGDAPGVTFIGAADTKMYGGLANVFTAGNGDHTVGAKSNARVTFGDGNNVIGLSGAGNVIVTGNGNNVLWKSTSSTSITMGDGNQSIDVGGTDNVVSVGVGNSRINVGFDGSPAGNERITVGGGTNTINAGGADDTIVIKGGNGNQLVASGSAATITIEAGSNNVVAQGANSVVNSRAGNNDIATNGNGDIFNLGSGLDTLWASGNDNQITAGSGTASINFLGQRDTIDLTHGTNTVIAQGTGATLILAAAGGSAAQIYGNVIAAGDVFDLRTAMASTTWDGRQSTLNSYLSVNNAGGGSVIFIDADGASFGAAAAIASLNNVAGLTYASLVAHSTLPAWA